MVSITSYHGGMDHQSKQSRRCENGGHITKTTTVGHMMSRNMITDPNTGSQADMSHEEMTLRIDQRTNKETMDDYSTKAGETKTIV